MPNDIIDNRTTETLLATALKTKLGVSETAKFAIGFFFLSGFKEIQDQLDGLKEVKLLIGSTTTKDTIEHLAEAHKRLDLAESVTKRAGALPKYTWDAPYLVLSLYRSTAAATGTLDQKVLRSLSKMERNEWQWLSTQQTVSAVDYADALGIPKRTAHNHLKRFVSLRLLRRIGSGPTTKYATIGS